jgi:hypothetical protein
MDPIEWIVKVSQDFLEACFQYILNASWIVIFAALFVFLIIIVVLLVADHPTANHSTGKIDVS